MIGLHGTETRQHLGMCYKLQQARTSANFITLKQACIQRDRMIVDGIVDIS